MDIGLTVGLVGWGLLALSAWLYKKLHAKYSLQKGVINALEKQLDLAQARISDLGGTPIERVRLDEEENIRRD